jgi:hypothetical protein
VASAGNLAQAAHNSSSGQLNPPAATNQSGSGALAGFSRKLFGKFSVLSSQDANLTGNNSKKCVAVHL